MTGRIFFAPVFLVAFGLCEHPDSGLIANDTTERPNIIFILTDDQGYGDLGRHHHPLLRTPNLDRLANESVCFDNFYVSPSCSPTRAALLTGMHEFRNGVTHTLAPRQQPQKDAVFLPQLLKTAGYRTGFIGKWHLGEMNEYAPKQRGFDWTSTTRNGPLEPFDPMIDQNGTCQRRPGYREDIFFDDAMTFIDESGDQPFFCYLATYSPHTPLAAPEEFISPFRDYYYVNEKQATFLGMVSNIDFNVGRLMNFLRERKMDQDTIVIFMTDNGSTEGLDVFNAGMRGCKCTIWEGGSRAMSFWHCPSRWKPKTDDHLTAHLDVVPTLCDLANVTIPDQLQSRLEGFSLRRLLESETPVAWHEERMLFQHVGRWPSGLADSHKYAMCGVKLGHYLLCRSRCCDNPACQQFESQCLTLSQVEGGATRAQYTSNRARFHWASSPRGRWVLFDTKSDPACNHDLSGQEPELVIKLAAAYNDWWEEVYPQMIESGGDRILKR